MKKKLLILAMCLFCTVPVNAADWVELESGNPNIKIFIDNESVKQVTKDVYTYAVLYKKGKDNPKIVYLKSDYKNEKTGVIRAEEYDEDNYNPAYYSKHTSAYMKNIIDNAIFASAHAYAFQFENNYVAVNKVRPVYQQEPQYVEQVRPAINKGEQGAQMPQPELFVPELVQQVQPEPTAQQVALQLQQAQQVAQETQPVQETQQVAQQAQQQVQEVAQQPQTEPTAQQVALQLQKQAQQAAQQTQQQVQEVAQQPQAEPTAQQVALQLQKQAQQAAQQTQPVQETQQVAQQAQQTVRQAQKQVQQTESGIREAVQQVAKQTQPSKPEAQQVAKEEKLVKNKKAKPEVQNTKPANYVEKNTSRELAMKLFESYVEQVKKDIFKNWKTSKDTVNQTVEMIISINADGSYNGYKILDKTSNESARRAAVAAVNLTAPFAKFPENKNFIYRTVNIPLVFEQKRFRKWVK